jgi:hypothetical protein
MGQSLLSAQPCHPQYNDPKAPGTQLATEQEIYEHGCWSNKTWHQVHAETLQPMGPLGKNNHDAALYVMGQGGRYQFMNALNYPQTL